MSNISIKMLFFTEDIAEDESAIKKSLDLGGVNLKLVCVDNEQEFELELDDKIFDIVLIGDPLINTTTLQVIYILDQRRPRIPRMILVGSLDDFSAIAILEATGTLQEVTKTTLGTLALMTHREMERMGEDFENKLKLKRSVKDMMEAWGRSLELRDKGTQGHTKRVTILAVKLARKTGMSKADIVNLQQGALLHDVGKIGIPDSILLKESALTDEEWVVMKTHPGLAYNMLKDVETLKDALDIPYCHHERWNGTGYPRGLVGKEIPIAARIFSVCDVYDALTSDRPYRDAWSKNMALDHIETLSGIALDPIIVLMFLEMMQ